VTNILEVLTNDLLTVERV